MTYLVAAKALLAVELSLNNFIPMGRLIDSNEPYYFALLCRPEFFLHSVPQSTGSKNVYKLIQYFNIA